VMFVMARGFGWKMSCRASFLQVIGAVKSDPSRNRPVLPSPERRTHERASTGDPITPGHAL
jgi:hypothetical protein